MKRLITWGIVLLLIVVGFTTMGCVDPDEAMPHYKVTRSCSPN